MKRIMLLFAALLASATTAVCTAGETGQEGKILVTARAYHAKHYDAWSAIVAAENAGEITLTGEWSDDAYYHTALWYTGALDDAGFYSLIEKELSADDPEFAHIYQALFRLGARGTDEGVRAKAIAELADHLDSANDTRRYFANLYLSKVYAHPNVRNYAEVLAMLKSGHGSGDAATAAIGALLRSGEKTPREIFDAMAAGLPELARRYSTPSQVSSLVAQLCTVARRAAVSDAEIYSALRAVSREICDKAVGSDDNAKKWGVAVGRLNVKMESFK